VADNWQWVVKPVARVGYRLRPQILKGKIPIFQKCFRILSFPRKRANCFICEVHPEFSRDHNPESPKPGMPLKNELLRQIRRVSSYPTEQLTEIIPSNLYHPKSPEYGINHNKTRAKSHFAKLLS